MDYTVSSSWAVSTPGGSTTLGMGASDTISVTQTIPANAAAGASASVTFNVVNGDGSSAVVTTTANQEYGVTVSVGTLTGLNLANQATCRSQLQTQEMDWTLLQLGTAEFGLQLNQIIQLP